MRATTRELLIHELLAHGVDWCASCSSPRSHARGFVIRGERCIHLDSTVRTRAAFLRALHELAHVILPYARLSWQREQDAETWARRRARELGVSVPRKVAAAGNRYVARKRRHGAKIVAGRG